MRQGLSALLDNVTRNARALVDARVTFRDSLGKVRTGSVMCITTGMRYSSAGVRDVEEIHIYMPGGATATRVAADVLTVEELRA